MNTGQEPAAVDGRSEPLVDEVLVLLIQAGSAEAFEHLVARWTPRLVRYVVRMLGVSPSAPDEARDIVQETWVSAMAGLRTLRDPKAFPAWIYGIATRRCADAIRTTARRRRLQADAATESVTQTRSSPSPDLSFELTDAIRQLPPTHRAVVHLFYREELSLEDIASILDVPVGTVKSRLHNARRALKILLGDAAPAGQAIKEECRD